MLRKRTGVHILTSLGLLAKVLVKLPAVRNEERIKFAKLLDFLSKIRVSVLLIFMAVGAGIVGYMVIEGYSFFDAYYMTIITLATVGFSEVRPLSDMGRIFTTFLLLFNLGIFTFAITSISVLLGGGQLQYILLDLFMIEKIEKISGHHIVCGFGRHGKEVASELHRQNLPFVVIESNLEKLGVLRENTDYFFLEGDATEDDILIDAGVRRAASILITLPDDAANLFVVISARQLNDRIKIISRSTTERDETKLRKAGADFVILPEKLGGFYMATLVKNPNLVEFFTLVSHLEGTTTVFEEFDCKRLPDSMIGKTIANSGLLEDNRVQVLAMRKPDGTYDLNPSLKNTIVEKETVLVLFGDIGSVNEKCK